MSYDIYIFPPSSYISKSHKLNQFKEADNFLQVLETKINEWNFSYICENKVAKVNKVKFHHLEKEYLSKCHIALYIVCSSSRSFFESSLKKLTDTCHKKNVADRVVVVSLEEYHRELKEMSLDVVYFGNNASSSENDDQWKDLGRTLEIKVQDIENNNNSMSRDGTLPLSIPNNNHSNKVKTIFHSLKLSFKKEKFSMYNYPIETSAESVPNIKVSEFKELMSSNQVDHNDVESVSKKDHTKLSLNSLFRKRKKKSKDPHLTLDSPASSCSGSKKSDNLSIDKYKSIDGFSETSPSSERSEEAPFSVFDKPKTQKSKMHNFKSKANKALQSANCVHSPHNNCKKHVENALSDVALFSSFVISASSDLPISSLQIDEKSHTITSSFKQKWKSELPITDSELCPENIINNIKYYSWSEEMIKYGEYLTDGLMYSNNQEMKPIKIQVSNYNCSDLSKAEEHGIACLEQISCRTKSNEGIESYISFLNENLSKTIEFIQEDQNYKQNENLITSASNGESPDEKYDDVFDIYEDILMERKVNNNHNIRENSKERFDNNFILNENDDRCNINEDKSFKEKENMTIDDNLVIEKSKKSINDCYDKNKHEDVIVTTNNYFIINTCSTSNDEEIQEGVIGRYCNFQYVSNFKSKGQKIDKYFQECKIGDLNVQDLQNYDKNYKEFQSKSDGGGISIEDNVELETELLKEIKLSSFDTLVYESNNDCNEWSLNEQETVKSEEKHSKLPTKVRNNVYSTFLEISDSIVISPPQSYISSITHYLIQNPIFVASLFTATALTAPIWSSFIRNNLDFGSTLYETVGRLLRNDMVQAIPNKLISASRVGAIAVTSPLRRYFIAVPNSNNGLICGYKMFLC